LTIEMFIRNLSDISNESGGNMSSSEQKTGQTQSVPPNVPPPYVAPPTPPTPQQVPQQVSISPEQKELMDIINELVMGAQELGFELITVPYELIQQHPELKEWYEVSKKQVLTVKKLIQFIRSRRTG